MKKIRIILILLFISLVTIFALQNSEIVKVNFFIWKIETSRAFLMLTCFISGVISTLLCLVPYFMTKGSQRPGFPYDFNKKDN